AIAVRLAAFGVTVIGVNRGGGAAPPGVSRVVTQDAVDEVLPQAGILALALPHTPATTGVMSAGRLAALPAGALLVNVGRGSSLDQEALVALLRSGHLAGAGLDVTDPEPLPAGHPLWALPNV